MQLHTCTHSRVPLLSFSFPLILLLHRYYFSSFSSFLLLISHIIFSVSLALVHRCRREFVPFSHLDSIPISGLVTYVYTCIHRILYIYIVHWYSVSSSHRITFLSSGTRCFFEGGRSISVFPRNNLSVENNTINN